MRSLAAVKYGFRIRTRNGAVVDNLQIAGCDIGDAERKLRQMYRDCEILASRSVLPAHTGRAAAVSYEEVVDLLTGR